MISEIASGSLVASVRFAEGHKTCPDLFDLPAHWLSQRAEHIDPNSI
jgi:hypothetical protein